MKTTIVAAFAASALLVSASNASAVNVLKNDKAGYSLDIAVLVQPQVQLTKDGAPDRSSTSTELFMRRARIAALGKVTRGLTFFIGAGQANLGKGGRWDAPFNLLDAFGSYEVARALTVDAGIMAVPFTRNTVEGLPFIHALDFHSALIHFPAGVGPGFRDAGVQLRGLAFGDHLHYRLAMFEGVRGPAIATTPAPAPGGSPPALPLNPAGEPRFAAMLRANILGVEDRFYFRGISFADKPHLSVGVGFDYQRRAVRIPTGLAKHAALSGDVFLEYPFAADDEVLIKAAIVHYADGTGNIATGTGFFGEAGVRHAWFEPLVGADHFRAEGGLQDYDAVKGGLNFWLRKHAANVKTEIAYTVDDRPANRTRALFVTLQGQVFF